MSASAQCDRLRAELAQAQQQLASMAAAQEDLLRAVAHDLRAPLRHITSYGALLCETLADLPADQPEVQEAQEFAATIAQSAQRMGQMIEALRRYAQTSRAPLECGAQNLGAAVQQARAELAALEAGRDVHWQISDVLPDIWADGRLLQQLLLELLSNALKFTRHAQPARISIALAAPTTHADRVRISVQDNGTGFDMQRAAGLGGLFQRLHREGEFAGLGTGLALCRLIARRHGAELAVTAEAGAGCCVTLDWPVAASGVFME